MSLISCLTSWLVTWWCLQRTRAPSAVRWDNRHIKTLHTACFYIFVMWAQVRVKILSKLPEETRGPLMKLHSCLNGRVSSHLLTSASYVQNQVNQIFLLFISFRPQKTSSQTLKCVQRCVASCWRRETRKRRGNFLAGGLGSETLFEPTTHGWNTLDFCPDPTTKGTTPV